MSKLDAYLDSVLGVADEPAQAAAPAQAQAQAIDYDQLASRVAERMAPRPADASNAGAPLHTSAGQVNPRDVTQWSHEDYERQFQLKAAVPHNRYDVRNRAFHREVRLSAEAAMARTKIQLGGRKP
jgi:hypothetical protein